MKKKDEKKHIAFAFDQNYITPVFVLLTSIFANNKGSELVFHAIAADVSDADKKAIADYINKEQASIVYYTFDLDKKSYFVLPEGGYITQATYYRLFFPSAVYGKVNTLLYIDTDVVVNGSLDNLFATDLEDFPIGACQDNGIDGLYELGKYFNAGMLLINVEEWEDQQVSEKVFKYLNDNRETIRYHDQDALNMVLAGNWKKLDNRYNLTFNDIPPYMPKAKLKSFVSDKVVIHYTGVDKPWSATSANKLRYLYHKYLKISPRAETKRYTANQPSSLRNLKQFAKVRMIELMSEFPFIMRIIKGNTAKAL